MIIITGGLSMSYFKYQGKEIYYTISGQGKPLLFLHGNTASSKMFEFICPLYQKDYQIILIDFMGNGKSARVDDFPSEIWIDQGHQIVELAKHLNCGKVNLIGTSGGAYAAINAALEAPELFDKVIGDSFDGRNLPDNFSEALQEERKFAMADEMTRGFYQWCQGEDWRQVVARDTRALVNLQENHLRLFIDAIENIKVPLLMVASKEDMMLNNDLEREFAKIASNNSLIQYKIFKTGNHPLVASRAKDIFKLVKDFI